jgi:hypothetical protein
MKVHVTSASTACRTGIYAAMATLIGLLLSGPPAIVLLAELHPQPPWQGAEVFAQNFHPSQAFPYWAGFFLVGAYVVLMASLHALATEAQKPRATAALVFTAAFASLVFLNYVLQTTVIPGLVRPYSPENAAVIALLSMSNPTSLAWALEMWAWAFLGVATWLASPIFSTGRVERLASAAFVANGVSSVFSALCTAARPAWVMTVPGFVGFLSWNALVFAMSMLVVLALRRRLRDQTERSSDHNARAPIQATGMTKSPLGSWGGGF